MQEEGWCFSQVFPLQTPGNFRLIGTWRNSHAQRIQNFDGAEIKREEISPIQKIPNWCSY